MKRRRNDFVGVRKGFFIRKRGKSLEEREECGSQEKLHGKGKESCTASQVFFIIFKSTNRRGFQILHFHETNLEKEQKKPNIKTHDVIVVGKC